MKAGETTVLRLLQGSKVFLIPNFQRRYAWRQTQWEEFWDDLIREYETEHDEYSQELDGHFLGSVVLHPAPGPASTLMRHLVIDGQQRLTTILVLLAAIRDVRSNVETTWNPDSYNAKYLMNQFDDDYPDRLVPTEFDRDSYVRTVRNGSPTGGIGQAYTYFRGRVERADEEGIDLAKLGDTLLIHMLLVEINTSTGDSVNNIFNTLNSKGLPLSATDLIRNELLLNLDEEKANAAYENYWLPMEEALVRPATGSTQGDSKFVTFFWAREVAENNSTTRKSLFQSFERRLRKELEALPPADRQTAVLGQFKAIYNDYLLFRIVLAPLEFEDPNVDIGLGLRQPLEDLRQWGSDPYIPIALWLLREHAHRSVKEDDVRECLQALLGYLVRRALVGIPTNNLNRLLSPLPTMAAARDELESLPSFFRRVLSRQGYRWPSDADVVSQIQSQPIYLSIKRSQTRFLLAAVERELAGAEVVEMDDLTIEHVMPQSMPEGWAAYLREISDADDEALLHTIGNLTLTGYNSTLSDGLFRDKAPLLLDSPLRMNELIGASDQWTGAEIRSRSTTLGEHLLRRFEGPPREEQVVTSSAEVSALIREELTTALQTMPDGAWTTDLELVKLLGVELNPVRTLVATLGPELARLVRAPGGEVPEWFSEELRDQVNAQGDESPQAHQMLGAERISEYLLQSQESILGETQDDEEPD